MSEPLSGAILYWLTRDRRPARPAVNADAQFDAVVIGGGLTGITSAYLLKRAGLRVALVEGDRCATGDSGQTSAHLTYVSDKPLLALVEDVGRDSAQALWEAGWAALRTIGDVVVRERIECAFSWTPGYLHLPIVDDPDPDDRARLAAESDLAADLGFEATFVEQAPLVDRPAIRFEKQARFEPLRYAHALIDRIDGGGSVVFESSPVSEIVPDPPAVVVRGYRLQCDDVVIATHLPTVAQPALVHAAWGDAALALFTSYVMAAEVPKGGYRMRCSGTCRTRTGISVSSPGADRTSRSSGGTITARKNRTSRPSATSGWSTIFVVSSRTPGHPTTGVGR